MKTHAKILPVVFIVLLSLNAGAQENTFNTAIGLRAGQTSGFTFKQFVGERSALEGIFGVWNNGVSFTALFEYYTPTTVEGLDWYYGGGGHGSFGTSRIYYSYYGERYPRYYYRSQAGLGIDGIMGLEYKIKPVPFALSVDMKPFLEINTSGNVYFFLDPGLGVKFVF